MDDDWIAKRVNEAQEAHPSVTDSAAIHITELIKGEIAGRQLSATELGKIARALLTDVTPQDPAKTGAPDAD